MSWDVVFRYRFPKNRAEVVIVIWSRGLRILRCRRSEMRCDHWRACGRVLACFLEGELLRSIELAPVRLEDLSYLIPGKFFSFRCSA